MEDYTLNWAATLIISIIVIAISLYIIRLLRYSREVSVYYYNKMLSWAIFLIISIGIVTISFYAVRLFHYLRNVYVTRKLVLIISGVGGVAIYFFAICLLSYMRKKDANGNLSTKKKVKVVFILGGPGSGKSTQCAKISKYFGYTHLSSGDLLRSEAESGSRDSSMIKKVMKEGELVPSKVVVDLLLRAMRESENNEFLIDGFPRDVENQVTFQNITKIVPEFVLFLDCPEEELKKRLLKRNQGREDDNIESIMKRFRVFKESTSPVIDHYNSLGKVYKIDGAKSPEKVFEDVKRVFLEHGDKVASF